MTSEDFKEKIKQYNDLIRGIKDLKERINKLESQPAIVKDSVKGSHKSFPYTQHTCVVEGIDVEAHERLLRRKKLLKRKCAELESMKEEIEIYINNNIQDERIRQILQYRFIDGMSWEKIAFKKYNNSVPAATLRKEFERFMKKL